MSGGTKQAELDRTAYLFKDILKSQGVYYALMMLIDSGYSREEISAIADRIKKII